MGVLQSHSGDLDGSPNIGDEKQKPHFCQSQKKIVKLRSWILQLEKDNKRLRARVEDMERDGNIVYVQLLGSKRRVGELAKKAEKLQVKLRGQKQYRDLLREQKHQLKEKLVEVAKAFKNFQKNSTCRAGSKTAKAMEAKLKTAEARLLIATKALGNLVRGTTDFDEIKPYRYDRLHEIAAAACDAIACYTSAGKKP